MSRRFGILLVLLVCLALALLAGVMFGSVALSTGDVWRAIRDGGGPGGVIIRELRLPRVVLGVLVGAALAASGTAYQSLFRNPLADPFIIGASSGAALGATLAIVAGGGQIGGGLSLVMVGAFLGALAAVAVVYALGAGGSPLTLLLAGVAVGTVLSATVSLIILVRDQSLQMVYYWVLGGLSGHGWNVMPALLSIGGGASMLLWALARPLDALAFGDEVAGSIGLPLGRARAAIVLLATTATAAAVAVSGIVGFVGLIGPHIARRLVGGRHGVLMPAAMMAGAMLLVLADLVARTAIAPVEIPVGILTSLLGGPFFLYLLRRRR
ncbi:MAG: iron ABC transporter permease [Candidatus Dadabacteria bacterium]|nr:MAG: iron ABC transporter permease [Candidatus Dadabacteria bacterium]